MKKENPQILNDYLNYLISIKTCSPGTIEIYNIHLLSFLKFIKSYLNIKQEINEFNKFILLQVKEQDVIAFLVYCNYTKENNPYTRQLKLVAIRGFYNWLLNTFKNEYIINPAENLGKIQKNIRLPKYLNLKQARQIQQIFTIKNSREPLKFNTIICLFLSSGMRVSELINVQFKDINFADNSIQIIGKGNKERLAYFSDYCKEQLQKYIKTRNDKSTYLFVNNRKEKMSRIGINYIVKKAFDLLNLNDKHYSTHTLRHTAATLLYMYVKEDTLLLKQFLGHSSVASTQIYTHIHDQKIKEAVEKNPLNNFVVKVKR